MDKQHSEILNNINELEDICKFKLNEEEKIYISTTFNQILKNCENLYKIPLQTEKG